LLVQEFEIIHHPNDGYFKAVFSSPAHSAEFFQSHLPGAAVAVIDWSSLENVSSAYVSEDIQLSHSDLVFSARAGSQKVLLYLVFEHQTTVDRTMPLRLLQYSARLLAKHNKEQGLPLPVIIPYVLHQGPETWNVSTRLEDLYSLPEPLHTAFLPFLPRFQHGLLDLSLYDPDTEEQYSAQRVVLQLMKMAREKKLLEFFEWLARDSTLRLTDALMHTSLMYALSADPKLDLQQLIHKLSTNPRMQTQAMSYSERLLIQGLEQGREEGYGQGVLKTCLRLARRKWGEVPEDLIARIETLEYPQLERLSEDLLDLGALPDLIAWLNHTRP
jgi:predicted transposase/invertase (TIGR01784 family)